MTMQSLAAIHVCGPRIWHDTELKPRPHLFLLSMVLPVQRAMLLLSFLFVFAFLGWKLWRSFHIYATNPTDTMTLLNTDAFCKTWGTIY